MPKFTLSEFIEPELETVWACIVMDNMEAADRFLESAHATFKESARMPGMGRPRHFMRAELRELRSFRVKGFENHLIFYHPTPDGIEVFHNLHGARDLESILEPRC